MSLKPPLMEAEKIRALENLVWEVLQTYFVLRSMRVSASFLSERGSGYWDLLSMVKTNPPMTVSDAARARSVSRQYMQKLANQLIAEGMIEMIDNPTHKGARKMQILPRGNQYLKDTRASFNEFLKQNAPGMDPESVSQACKTLTDFQQCLRQGLEGKN
jgi:DNA-binding MarR family transcriptional regulator